MRPVVVASSFSTTARCAGCSMYSRSPAAPSNLARKAWVYPPERPEKSSPTERSTVLGTSSLKARIDEIFDLFFRGLFPNGEKHEIVYHRSPLDPELTSLSLAGRSQKYAARFPENT